MGIDPPPPPLLQASEFQSNLSTVGDAGQLHLRGLQDLPVCVPEREMRMQAGNAMSANVLERLLLILLPSIGFTPWGSLPDRYNGMVATALPPCEVTVVYNS